MGSKIHFRITKNLREKIRNAATVLFFLDYDGTLTPIRKTPRLAKAPRKSLALLKKLSRQKWADVFIVSGRSLKDIKRVIGLKSITYVGNHGFELEHEKIKYFNKKAGRYRKYILQIYRKLKRNIRIKGSIVEDKTYTLSVHYRLVGRNLILPLKRKLYDIAGPYIKKKKIVITKGKKVFEVRPAIKWGKGAMVNFIIGKLRKKNTFPIYIGDDKTDEDAFRALKNKGLTVLVAKRGTPTYAKLTVSSPKKALVFLDFIIKLKSYE